MTDAPGPRLRRLTPPAAWGAGGASAHGAGALVWGRVEAEARVVRTHTVPVLPAGARPLRVLHLSDIHLLPRHRRRLEWLCSLADLEPDLVVDTGDNISSAASIPLLLDALAPLLAVPGVFVPGSNDYFTPKPANPLRYLRGPSELEASRSRLPTEDLFSAFRAAGWTDLTDRAADVVVGSGPDAVRIRAAGTDDPHLGLDRWPGFDLADEGAAGDAPLLRLGVTHAPYRRVLDAMTADGADLLLAGHTHGGQVCLPFAGALVTNCDLPRSQASGLSSWTAAGRTVPLEVSAGIGTAPSAPVRTFCRPEAVVLDLVPRA